MGAALAAEDEEAEACISGCVGGGNGTFDGQFQDESSDQDQSEDQSAESSYHQSPYQSSSVHALSSYNAPWYSDQSLLSMFSELSSVHSVLQFSFHSFPSLICQRAPCVCAFGQLFAYWPWDPQIKHPCPFPPFFPFNPLPNPFLFPLPFPLNPFMKGIVFLYPFGIFCHLYLCTILFLFLFQILFHSFLSFLPCTMLLHCPWVHVLRGPAIFHLPSACFDNTLDPSSNSNSLPGWEAIK